MLTPLPTAESRGRDGSDITDPSLVSKGSATPDKDSRYAARMFHMLGVALSYLLGTCPVSVDARSALHPLILKPGIAYPVSTSV